MAKGTRANGDTYTDAELDDQDAPIRIRRAELGVVDRQCLPTDGTVYSASSRVRAKSAQSTERKSQEPAPNAESLSEQKDSNSTVPSETTDIPTTVQESRRATPPTRSRRPASKGTATTRSRQARASAIGADEDFV